MLFLLKKQGGATAVNIQINNTFPKNGNSGKKDLQLDETRYNFLFGINPFISSFMQTQFIDCTCYIVGDRGSSVVKVMC